MTADASRRYRVRNSRATVFDALNAVHDLDFRADIADAILGRIPLGTEFDGTLVSIALSPDLTAHGIEITWPLDVERHAGIVAYVLPSSVDEVIS